AGPAHQRRRNRGRRPPGAAPGAADRRGHRARGHRAGRQPLGDGAVDHDAPAAVGRGGRLRRRDRRLRDRRHAGRLRPLRDARARRGLRGRHDRLRHQPRLEPRRRHHVLGHGRRRARGRAARVAGDRGLAAVGGARARLPARPHVRLRGRRGVHREDRGRAGRGSTGRRHAPQHQRPGGRPGRRRRHPAGQAHLPRRAQASRGGRPAPSVLGLRRLARAPRGGGHRPRGGRRRPRRRHPDSLRPHRQDRDVRARAPRPRAAAAARRRGSV
ncbi:MAG: 5'-nucleotidase SurE, partial [uncultured Solirubrobacteraceae bacterium]